MMPAKIGFVLLSNSRAPIPSTRISVLNMLPYLEAEGFTPHMLWQPETGDEQPDLSGLLDKALAEDLRIVFFQKVHGPSAESLARELSKAGVRTVYGVCDLVQPAMVRATDATVAVSEHLRSLYPPDLQAKIHVVHDGIENPQAFKTDWGDHRASRSRPLRAVLVTSNALTMLPVVGTPPSWLEVRVIGRYSPATATLQRLKEARWRLLEQAPRDRLAYLSFLMHKRIRRIAWDPIDVYRHMMAADVGIIPVETGAQALPGWSVKSENRLTMKMAIGLPVVATPIPSYRPVVEHGSNGLLATTRAEWLECLESLRAPEMRRRLGEQARKSVLESYSMDLQSRRLIAVLHKVLVSSQTAVQCSVPT